MRKLVVVCLMFSSVLLAPATATAATPTVASLAKAVATLQKQVASQQATIKSLKTKLADASSVLALAPYVKLDRHAENGVAGSDNSIADPYASVSGGQSNWANGDWASVSGGNSINETYTDGWATSGYEHH